MLWITSWNAFPQRIKSVLTVVTMLVEGMVITAINFCSLHWLNNLRWPFFQKAYLLFQRCQKAFLVIFYWFVIYIFIADYLSALCKKVRCKQIMQSRFENPSTASQTCIMNLASDIPLHSSCLPQMCQPPASECGHSHPEINWSFYAVIILLTRWTEW